MDLTEIVQDFLDMLRRRRGLVVAVTMVGCVLSVFIALQSPRVYEAVEVIQIEQPKIAGELAPAMGPNASARRLQQIEQRLMARQTMLEIAEQFGVFDDLPGLGETDRLIFMRESISINAVAAAREGYSDDGTISVLSITARAGTAQTAQALAHDVARRTLALSAEQRLAIAQETLDFFELQEDRLHAEISAVEDAREAFRQSNAMAIPQMVAFQQEELARINAALRDLDRQAILLEGDIARRSGGERITAVDRRGINAARDELAVLDRQRAALSAKQAELRDSIARVPAVERALGDYDRRLTQLQEELQVVAARRREAETNYALEERDKGGRLTVIEPAVVPEYPVSRSRKMTAVMGGGASLILAIGLAVLLDLIKPVLRSPARMERQVGLLPVVSIPQLEKTRRRRWLFGRTARGRTGAKDPNTLF